jgi:hypothetical protein
MSETPLPEIDPEQLAQWERNANDMEMEQRRKTRRARDRYYFFQGLATGIAGTVIVLVVAWSLWT